MDETHAREPDARVERFPTLTVEARDVIHSDAADVSEISADVEIPLVRDDDIGELIRLMGYESLVPENIVRDTGGSERGDEER